MLPLSSYGRHTALFSTAEEKIEVKLDTVAGITDKAATSFLGGLLNRKPSEREGVDSSPEDTTGQSSSLYIYLYMMIPSK